MKQQLEQLLMFLIPAILIEKLLKSYSNTLFGDLFGGNTESIETLMDKFPSFTLGELITYVNGVNLLIGLLPIIVIAVWLWKLEKRINGHPFLWSVGAFFLSYWILPLYIGQEIYEKVERKST